MLQGFFWFVVCFSQLVHWLQPLAEECKWCQGFTFITLLWHLGTEVWSRFCYKGSSVCLSSHSNENISILWYLSCFLLFFCSTEPSSTSLLGFLVLHSKHKCVSVVRALPWYKFSPTFIVFWLEIEKRGWQLLLQLSKKPWKNCRRRFNWRYKRIH